MGWSRLVRIEATESTNTDLMRALTDSPREWPHLSVLVAESQTAGRGRAGRPWVTRPGASLTASIVLSPDDDAPPPTWIPLLVGLAVRRALVPWLPTALKWPNDVVLARPAARGGNAEWGWPPKLGGILCELHPSGNVVAGIGINCLESSEELPVPWAASIASATGTSPGPLEVLDALGASLPEVLADWASHPEKVRGEYEEVSVVVGEWVRTTAGEGRAVGIAEDGALLVETAAGRVAVNVGDVEHVR